jgi:hypothetical protein
LLIFIIFRVQSQAAATLRKLCDGIPLAEFAPYLDPIVEHLLGLLNHTDNNVKEPKRYVQEEIMSVFATIVNKSQAMFAKVSGNHKGPFGSLLTSFLAA